MGYSLAACVVDIDALHSLLGSKNEQLLIDMITAYRDQMLDVDVGMEFFEEFEKDIQAEYDAYIRGDFSYHHPISAPDPEGDDDEDALTQDEVEEFTKVLLSDDDDAIKESLESLVGDLFSGAQLVGDTPADDIEPTRDLSIGGALVQMILGRPMDPRMGHVYGYALDILVFHFGESVDSSVYESLRSSFDWVRAVVQSARQRGIESKLLERKSTFFHRGSPFAVPEAEDFPSLGYLTAAEAGELKEKLSRAGLVPTLQIPLDFESEQQWGEAALLQLLNWVTEATKVGHGVMTVYC